MRRYIPTNSLREKTSRVIVVPVQANKPMMLCSPSPRRERAEPPVWSALTIGFFSFVVGHSISCSVLSRIETGGVRRVSGSSTFRSKRNFFHTREYNSMLSCARSYPTKSTSPVVARQALRGICGQGRQEGSAGDVESERLGFFFDRRLLRRQSEVRSARAPG